MSHVVALRPRELRRPVSTCAGNAYDAQDPASSQGVAVRLVKEAYAVARYDVWHGGGHEVIRRCYGGYHSAEAPEKRG